MTGVIAGALSAVPFIRFVLAAPVAFYALIATALLHERGFTDSIAIDNDDSDPDSDIRAAA